MRSSSSWAERSATFASTGFAPEGDMRSSSCWAERSATFASTGLAPEGDTTTTRHRQGADAVTRSGEVP
jgi:hypothetical protein